MLREKDAHADFRTAALALIAAFAYLVMHLQVFAWARRRWPRLAETRKCLDCATICSVVSASARPRQLLGNGMPSTAAGIPPIALQPARLVLARLGCSSRPVGRVFTLDYGRYWLIEGPAHSGGNWRSRIAVAGGGHGIGLDGVAEYLFGEHYGVMGTASGCGGPRAKVRNAKQSASHTGGVKETGVASEMMSTVSTVTSIREISSQAHDFGVIRCVYPN